MSQNKSQAFSEAAGKYFALKAKGANELALLRARVDMMRLIPPDVEQKLYEVAKRHGLTKADEYDAEDDVMRMGWSGSVNEIKGRLLVCENEETANALYLILQDSNRFLGVETEPFEKCAPLIGPAVEAANKKGLDLINKLMGKGSAT